MPLSGLLEGDFFNRYIKIGTCDNFLCSHTYIAPPVFVILLIAHFIAGNILMLSEGRPGVDDRYSLKDGKLVPERSCLPSCAIECWLILISGVLRLELAKDKYERCGLVGQPVRDAGRKHFKTRYGGYGLSVD